MKPRNKLALFSFILGFASVILGLGLDNYAEYNLYDSSYYHLIKNAAIIFLIGYFIAYASALFALLQIRKTNEKGKYLAGFIIISPFLMALYMIIGIFMLFSNL